MREIAPMSPCVRISGLKVNRDRIVNSCLDALTVSSCCHFARSGAADRIDMIDMAAGVGPSGCFNPAAGKGLVVIAGRGSTGVRPLLDITHLHTHTAPWIPSMRKL